MVRKIVDPYARYFLNTVLAEKRSKTLQKSRYSFKGQIKTAFKN